jgi:hypothetical protein
MGRRLMGAFAGLSFSACSLAGSMGTYAADLTERYDRVVPQAKAYRMDRRLCVDEHGPDAPPYGYGCMDHWIKVRNTHEVIQDNGTGYTIATETIRRRYPPQVYAPPYEVPGLYEAYYAGFGQR